MDRLVFFRGYGNTSLAGISNNCLGIGAFFSLPVSLWNLQAHREETRRRIEINYMNFFEGYIENDKPVVVDFYAVWNQSSQLMDPVLQELKDQLGERAGIIKIDIEKEAQLAKKHNIWSVPTIAIFKKGQEVWRKSGIVPAHEILHHLKFHFS